MLAIGVSANSQSISVNNSTGGLILSGDDSNVLNGVITAEECWCYSKSNDSAVSIEPIIFPLPVKRNGKWGALDKNLKEVIPFENDNPVLMTDSGKVELIGFKVENHNWTRTDNSKLKFLDSTKVGKKTMFVNDVFRGTFIASEDSLFWGMLDSKMKRLLKFNYTSSHHTGESFRFSSKGYITFRENKAEGYHGILNHKGKVLIPFKYKLLSYIVEDEEHIYAMREDLKRGYINIKGEITLTFQFDKIPREIKERNLMVTKNYTWFADKDLKQIGYKYQALEKKGDIYFFKRNGKWGVMDDSLNVYINPVYSSIIDGPRIRGDKDFKCYIVVKNGLYGLITLKGESIIKPAYECLCGLGYYAPSTYYIEFKKAEMSYKFDKEGTLIEKGGKSGGNCFCE
jgi:hypothetical protein